MILTLWEEVFFKKCYKNEEVEREMLSKNTAVILPQLNSPQKIKGTYALLKKRLGKKVAQEVVTKNPGVLVCSPQGLQPCAGTRRLAARPRAGTHCCG